MAGERVRRRGEKRREEKREIGKRLARPVVVPRWWYPEGAGQVYARAERWLTRV